MSPAARAGAKVSFSARPKAFIRTRLRLASPRCRAMLPRQMVVLVRMAGSSSTCSLARCLSALEFKVACFILGASIGRLLSVSSRRKADVSAKPFSRSLYTCASMSSGVRCGPIASMFCSSEIRTARSLDEKRRTITGNICDANSSGESPAPILSIAPSPLAGAPPNSSALASSGSTLRREMTGEMASSAAGMRRKNDSLSAPSLSAKLSRKPRKSVSALEKKSHCSSSFFGLSRRAGVELSSR
mmetsp:Transcript_1941/g.5616  ORF Transcript_1941/g.5616 Transcript_1941/m.5616 type:complete len:244 (-) Transcript_1941:1083-1814(-)